MIKNLLLVSILLISIGYLNAQTGAEEIKLNKIKSIYLKNPESNYRYFEPDEDAKFYGRKNTLSSTNWGLTYTELDFKKLEDQVIKNLEILVEAKPDSSIVIKIQSNFDIEFELPYVRISYEPIEISTDGDVIELKNMNLSFKSANKKGEVNIFKETIPYDLEKELDFTKDISINGILTVQLCEHLEQRELKENVELFVDSNAIELLQVNVGRAYLKESGKIRNNEYKIMCLDEHGLKPCGMSFTMPSKMFTYYLKGKSKFEEREFQQLVESLTIKDLDDKIKIYDSKMFLKGMVLFSANGRLFSSDKLLVKEVKSKK